MAFCLAVSTCERMGFFPYVWADKLTLIVFSALLKRTKNISIIYIAPSVCMVLDREHNIRQVPCLEELTI